MLNSMSKPNKSCRSITAELNTVWIVNADESYDVVKRKFDLPGIVAIRTVSGEGRLILQDDKEIELTDDTIIFAEHKKIKRYFCSGSSWEFFWFEFTTENLYLLTLNEANTVEFTAKEKDMLTECFHKLNSAMNFSALSSSTAFCSALMYWITSVDAKPSEDFLKIERITKYISTHIANDIPISTLAGIAGMSERTFRTVFKKHTGMSPKNYIMDKRLNMANELLLNTDMQIKAISSSLGFADQYYFSKVFKEKFGLPPHLQRIRGK